MLRDPIPPPKQQQQTLSMHKDFTSPLAAAGRKQLQMHITATLRV